MTYSITDFTKEFYSLQSECSSYRMGQHFINKMKINLEGTPFEERSLWNEWNPNLATETIYSIIEYYQWDCNDLPVKDDYQAVNRTARENSLSNFKL